MTALWGQSNQEKRGGEERESFNMGGERVRGSEREREKNVSESGEKVSVWSLGKAEEEGVFITGFMQKNAIFTGAYTERQNSIATKNKNTFIYLFLFLFICWI